MTAKRIAIVVHEGVQALDVAGPVDVFSEANGFLEPDDAYSTVLIGASREPIRASNGMRMIPDLAFEEVANEPEIILVAGGPGLPVSQRDDEICEWLVEATPNAELYGSICTGAFTLGHAGLLDGRAVTTHWQNAARLASLFPDAQVDHDRIYLRDGRLITSAGVTAGIDLALSLVSEHHGFEVARSVAKRLVVVAQRQGGQSQFSPFIATTAEPDAPLARVQRHVLENLGDTLSIERLAQIAGTSERTLGRLFKEIGTTPHEFVEGARLDVARGMLEGSEHPLKKIAYECGFGNPERMRAVFIRRLGLAPVQYRATFRLRAGLMPASQQPLAA